ncbi:tyrosine-protein phosphatase [Bacillus subtilis]|nr:tyrosine-protein phosphatase [Bacillus subtilis]
MTKPAPLPPNWRPILFGSPPQATPGPTTIYRAATPSLATPDELDACPAGITWVDLRNSPERLLDPERSLGWPSIHMPLAVTDSQFTRARMVDTLSALLTRQMTFGDLYIQMLDEFPDRFATAIETVTQINGPVLLACQGGRDRTGTLVAVILDLVGVERSEIIADYLRTNDDQLETIRRQPDSEGERMLADYDMTCLASDIEQVLDNLADRGGARGYLSPHITGNIDETIRHLRARILRDSASLH